MMGTALSLSVLTMEEVGKMMLLDGLLFAKRSDYKDKKFRSGFRKHPSKLQFLDLFPFFVTSLGTADPRYEREGRYKQALALTIRNLKVERAALAPWIGEDCDLTELDRWKKTGFYSEPQGDRFLTPRQAVQEGFARAVNTLAWRFITTIDFLLKGGNLEGYFDRARRIREKASEADHQWMEKIGSQIADEIFGSSSEGESDEQENKATLK
jgi:AbiV family abortive infection protein